MSCERARLESRGTAELSSMMRREAGGWGYTQESGELGGRPHMGMGEEGGTVGNSCRRHFRGEWSCLLTAVWS